METERKRSFIINVVYYGIMLAFLAVAVKFALPMLTPFVLAFVIAYVLRRPTRYLCRKFGLPKKPVAMGLVLVFYCGMGILLSVLASKTYIWVRDLIMMLPHIYTEHLEPAVADVFMNFEELALRTDENLFSLIQGYDEQFMQWLGSLISNISGRAVGAASSLAAEIPGLFIELVLLIISTFFIAADYPIMKEFCLRQMGPKTAELFLRIKEYLVGTLFVCIASYAIIATLTFIELSIGLSILKLKHPFLIAMLIAIFDILPVLGTGGIMIPWAIFSFLQGNFTRGLGLLLIYVIITVIRNIVEPKFVGSKLGLHPVVTLSSMFAGAQMFGVIGLFGFPIGLSLLGYLNDTGTIRILKSKKK